MYFTIGFTMACALGVSFIFGTWLLLLCAFCLVALAAVLAVPSTVSRRIACILIGCTVGLLWFWCFDLLYLSPARSVDGQSQMMCIEVTDYSWPSEYGITATGKIQLDGKAYKVQFYINDQLSLSPGDQVEGGFRLAYTGVGGERSTDHKGKGIFLLAYPKVEESISYSEKVPYRYFPAVLGQKLLALLENVFPADTAPFAKALLLGDTEDLSFETVFNLKDSGIYHVTAVSGMHVSILFALVYLLCGKRRGLTALIGLPVLVLFSAVAGFSPSIVRACIMQGLMILAMLVNKEYDPPTALSASVLAILAVNPISITSVSLQLSAGCMVGIFLFTERIYRYILKQAKLSPEKRKSIRSWAVRWVAGSVSVTLGAMSITTPLCAIYFGSISLISVLTNLLTLWVISLVFYGILAVCIFGALWAPVGTCIAWIISWLIRFVLWVTDMLVKLPFSSVYMCSVYIVAWLIFAYLLLTIFFINKRKHPVLLVGCILVGFVGAIAFSWIEPRLDNYRMTAVDVGQGQCLILQNNGKYYMVDCGGDSDDIAADRAIQQLLSQGVFRLDGLIITHYDQDHAGGAAKLLKIIPADKLYLPIFDEQNEIRDALSSQYGEIIQWVDTDISLDEADITIYPSFDTEDANESSLCILFQPEDCDILITGDRAEEGERALMAHVELPDLEILVAGHHGSRTSTSWDFLFATRPEIAVISVGEDNRYGHPSEETLERLKLFDCEIYRTDIMGTVILRG